MRAFRYGLVAAAVAFASPAMAATIVTNGGFENGDLSGWTQFGNTRSVGVAPIAAFEGQFAGFFGPPGSTGGIFQTLMTAVGSVYSYSFALANFGLPTNSFNASIGGTSVLTLTNVAPFAYRVYSGTFTATSTATDLRFTFQNDPGIFRLDAVSVNLISGAGAVPEPAAWAMMIGGFGLAGAALRRRRKAAKVTVSFG